MHNMAKWSIEAIKRKIAEAEAIMRNSGSASLRVELIQRPLNQEFLNVDGRQVPEVVADLLSQLDNPRLRTNKYDVLAWETVAEPYAMHAAQRSNVKIEEAYFERVKKAGAAVVEMANHRWLIMYPRSVPFMRELFFETGFGVDDYVSPFSGEPILEDINSPQKLQKRLADALVIFDEITTERPTVLTQIGCTSAKLEAVDRPDRKWADKWSTRMWDYYVTHKSEATFVPGFDPVHSFTRRECFRLGRLGVFLLGGY